MDNTIAENLERWNENHTWAKGGDEWDGQAEKCGILYETWKQSLIDTLILPNVTDKSVLEIAPGYGRWSEHILKVAKRVVLVDLSPNCIEHCRERFGEADNIEYHVNDGLSLPADLTSEIDFVWSYDSFVHMNADVIYCYFQEFARVLKPDGKAIIHHANRGLVRLAFLRNLGRGGRLLYRYVSQGLSGEIDDGWRSDVSAAIVSRLVESSGLIVEEQIQYWGENGCGVPRFNDRITTIRKPRSA